MSDKISNLPDDLLLHILSSKSLQTKDVVATSLLSKRWRSVWHSIPKLEIHDPRFTSYVSFVQFVHGALDSVDLASVKMFVLDCEDFHDMDYFDLFCGLVDRWLDVALKTKLEYLKLWFASFPTLIRVPLPSSVFRCSSLRTLKLERVDLRYVSDFNLPLLKTLHLSVVDLKNPESLAVLLSKCVRIEELMLRDLRFEDSFENSRLDIRAFPHIVIAVVPPDLFSPKAFSNVTFLCLDKWFNIFPGDYQFPTFYNLSHLEVSLRQNGWTSMVSCLPSFPKLETLIIREGDEVLDCSPETSPEIPPCVSSHLKNFALIGFNYKPSEFEIVGFIMKNARVLRSVRIMPNKYSSREAVRPDIFETLSLYPKCSQNCSVFVEVSSGSIYQNLCSNIVSPNDFSYYFQDDKFVGRC